MIITHTRTDTVKNKQHHKYTPKGLSLALFALLRHIDRTPRCFYLTVKATLKLIKKKKKGIMLLKDKEPWCLWSSRLCAQP